MLKNKIKNQLPQDPTYWLIIGPLTNAVLWLSLAALFSSSSIPAIIRGNSTGFLGLTLAFVAIAVAGKYVNTHYRYLQSRGYLAAVAVEEAERQEDKRRLEEEAELQETEA